MTNILRQKAKNNKQRKLANIRTRNELNRIYLEMKLNGQISDFKIVGVKIKNRVQSAGIKILPITPVQEINVSFTCDKFDFEDE